MSLQIGQQYFEGYEEKFVPHGDGYKKVRIYQGDKYVLTGNDSRWKKWKMLIRIVIFFFLMLGAGSMPVAANVTSVVVLPYAVGLLSGGYYAIGVFHAMTAPREMTAYTYKEMHGQLWKGAAAASLALLCTTAANMLCLLVRLCNGLLEAGRFPWELLNLCANAICAIIMVANYTDEKKAVYMCIPGEKTHD